MCIMHFLLKSFALVLLISRKFQATVAGGREEWRTTFVHVLNFTSSLSISASSESDCAKYASQQEWPKLFRHDSASGICYLSEFEKLPDKNLTQPADHYRCMTKVPPLKGCRLGNGSIIESQSFGVTPACRKYTCDDGVYTKTVCPSPFTKVFLGGCMGCYYMTTEADSWEASQNVCISMDADLASPHPLTDEALYENLASFMGFASSKFWLGIYKTAQSLPFYQVSAPGSPPFPGGNFWHPGQPNGDELDPQLCVYYHPYTLRLCDQRCTDNYKGLCKIHGHKG